MHLSAQLPALSPDFPQKVYVETTTRCNLRCRMCVKHAQGSCIEERDLDTTLFARLLPSLSHTGFLILNGIGEPLLHPELTTMISQARRAMPPAGVIGFQSNGMLLTQDMADNLLRAGLDTVCLSVDSLEPLRGGEHQRSPVERAIQYLRQTSRDFNRPVSIGLEVVLQRTTVQQLPLMIEWAHQRGVDYIIASHLFSYDGHMDGDSLFSPCSRDATDLFAKWSQQARDQGLDLANLPATHLKFKKNERDEQLLSIGAAMQQEAREQDINIHFPNLLKFAATRQREIEHIWQQAFEKAKILGIHLTLPPLQGAGIEQTILPLHRGPGGLHCHQRRCHALPFSVAHLRLHGQSGDSADPIPCLRQSQG